MEHILLGVYAGLKQQVAVLHETRCIQTSHMYPCQTSTASIGMQSILRASQVRSKRIWTSQTCRPGSGCGQFYWVWLVKCGYRVPGVKYVYACV